MIRGLTQPLCSNHPIWNRGSAHDFDASRMSTANPLPSYRHPQPTNTAHMGRSSSKNMKILIYSAAGPNPYMQLTKLRAAAASDQKNSPQITRGVRKRTHTTRNKQPSISHRSPKTRYRVIIVTTRDSTWMALVRVRLYCSPPTAGTRRWRLRMPPLWPPTQRVCGWWLRKNYCTFRGFRTWLLCAAAVAVRLQYCKNGSCSSPTEYLSGYALRTRPSSIALSFRREGVRVVCGLSVVSHRSPLYSTLKLPTDPSEQTSRRALSPCFRFHGHHFPSDCTEQRDPQTLQG